jgi:hypothetical protein
MERMKNSTLRFVIYSALWTVAVGLILLGITSLTFLGIGMAVLAVCFSVRQQGDNGPVLSFVVFAVIAVVNLILHLHHGDVFARQPRPLWSWIFLPVIWIGAIFIEFRSHRKSRSAT